MATELIADKFLQEQLLPGTVGPIGNRSPDAARHGVYPCAPSPTDSDGMERWCAIAVTNDQPWRALRSAIDEPWTGDPTFATAAGRLEHAADPDARVAAWTEAHTVDEVEAALRAAGVPVSRAVTGDDVAANAADHASGFFAPLDHPSSGTQYYTGLPFTLNGGRVPPRRPPMLGEHTEAVLYDLLGLESDEVGALLACGAVGY